MKRASILVRELLWSGFSKHNICIHIMYAILVVVFGRLSQNYLAQIFLSVIAWLSSFAKGFRQYLSFSLLNVEIA